jgi:hypothetical protein
MLWNYICLSKLTLKVEPLNPILVTRAGDIFTLHSHCCTSPYGVFSYKNYTVANKSSYLMSEVLNNPPTLTRLCLWPFFEICSLWFCIFSVKWLILEICYLVLYFLIWSRLYTSMLSYFITNFLFSLNSWLDILLEWWISWHSIFECHEVKRETKRMLLVIV